MPIKPENRARYPKDWKAIRARILARADNCCEWCGAVNRTRIARGQGDDDGTYMTDDANVWCANTGAAYGQRRMSDFDVVRMVDVVLTIAHMGLPAHLPVHFHVTRPAKADNVIRMVGLIMPCKAESPEWAHMMHRRALAEFARSPAAIIPTDFFISFPGGISCGDPAWPVVHEPAAAMPPEAIRLTDWCLVTEPFQAARIAAETSTGCDVVTADAERLAATLAYALSKPAFRSAQFFEATGVRASHFPVADLLRRQPDQLRADFALTLTSAIARHAADARPLDPAPLSGSVLNATGHAGILLHADEYPENCADDNLRALCQRCHLRYDAPHHAETRAAGRRAALRTNDLFEGAAP